MYAWILAYQIASVMLVVLTAASCVYVHLKLKKNKMSLPGWTWAAIAVFVLFGLLLADYMGENERQNIKNMLAGLAPTYAVELQEAKHSAITPETPKDDPRYNQLIAMQIRWLNANSLISDVYTMRRRPDGRVIMVVDSETDYNRDGRYEGDREMRTPIGEVFTNVTPVMLKAFAGEAVFDDTALAGDRWGVWVSAYAPIKAPDASVDAIVGVDFDALLYFKRIGMHRLAGIGLGALMIVILLATGIIIALRDGELKHQKAYEEELRRSRDTAEALRKIAEREALEKGELLEKAEAAHRAKSEFLAVMSHELRTPMHGITGVTSLFEMTTLSPDQQQYTRLLNECAQNLVRILDDVLDTAALEAGKLKLVAQQFQLRETINSSVELLQPKALAKGLSLEVKIDPGLPTACIGDAGRVRQILINLVSNAIKFTDKGSVSLTVTRDTSSAVPNATRFELKDSGIGIPDENKSRIFERFFQVDQSITRRFQGTGIGLSICKGLVDLMKGEIGFTSKHGEGSTFWFTLPLPEYKPESALSAIDQQNVATLPLTVLVAEDSSSNRFILNSMLTAIGCKVDLVDSGNKAVEAAKAKRYDVIIMDYHMSPMDGVTATERIREIEKPLGRQTPIIALTADVMKEARDRCMAAGMDDFLLKPVDLATLRNTLSKIPRTTHAGA